MLSALIQRLIYIIDNDRDDEYIMAYIKDMSLSNFEKVITDLKSTYIDIDDISDKIVQIIETVFPMRDKSKFITEINHLSENQRHEHGHFVLMFNHKSIVRIVSIMNRLRQEENTHFECIDHENMLSALYVSHGRLICLFLEEYEKMKENKNKEICIDI